MANSSKSRSEIISLAQSRINIILILKLFHRYFNSYMNIRIESDERTKTRSDVESLFSRERIMFGELTRQVGSLWLMHMR